MTNNNDEKPITDVKLEQKEKKQGLTEQVIRKTVEALNAGLGKIGAKQIPLDELKNYHITD